VKRLAPVLLAAVAVVVCATPARADEQIPSGKAWGGSNVQRPEPITSPVVELTITGRIQNNGDLGYAEPAVAVTLDNDLETGCDLAPAGPATKATLSGPTFTPGTLFPSWKRYAYTADLPFAPQANGSYAVYVCINGVPRLDTVALVHMPAPTVTNLVATASGHDVKLTWDDARPMARDLSGYRIERSLGSGAFEPVESIGPNTPSFTDTTIPAGGGEATYRVIATRPEVADGAASNTAAASYQPAPAGSTGSGGGPGGGGGTGTTGGSGGSGGSNGAVIPGRPSGSGSSAIRVPRVGTPSRNFFPALLAPPVDTGFSEELPYDEQAEPGDELAGDDLASDAVDGLPGKGLAIPIAVGLVLGVWGLHLRFLARAARPEYAEPIEIL
jgi:hypothetical protein